MELQINLLDKDSAVVRIGDSQFAVLKTPHLDRKVTLVLNKENRPDSIAGNILARATDLIAQIWEIQELITDHEILIEPSKTFGLWDQLPADLNEEIKSDVI